MKKIIFMLLMLLIALSLVQAEKLADLEEINKPELMEIVGDTLLIVEGAEVYSYDIKDLKFKKKFGRKGEGPGELKTAPSIANYIIPLKDSFLIASMDKSILFNVNGDVIREFRIPLFTNYLYPANENYIGMRFKPGDKGIAWFELTILDKEMKDIKVFHKQKMSGGQNMVDLTFDGMGIAVSGDKLYVENSPDGFEILVFDMNGNSISKIKKDYKKVKFTDSYKERTMNKLKESPVIRELGWENFKKLVKITHGEYLPLIQDMVIDKGKIYVKTNNEKDGQVEFIVLDLKGNIIKIIFLPIMTEMDFGNKIFGRPARFYKIYNGKYYYLKENIDEEMWELYKVDIDLK
ncbi:MAG: hypothetical protein KAS97_08365 [Candidatus Aminicenantes bacterium]|nr:hypothetical protein [Candidatus Aminicenantes bacterium]